MTLKIVEGNDQRCFRGGWEIQIIEGVKQLLSAAQYYVSLKHNHHDDDQNIIIMMMINVAFHHK